MIMAGAKADDVAELPAELIALLAEAMAPLAAVLAEDATELAALLAEAMAPLAAELIELAALAADSLAAVVQVSGTVSKVGILPESDLQLAAEAALPVAEATAPPTAV